MLHTPGGAGHMSVHLRQPVRGHPGGHPAAGDHAAGPGLPLPGEGRDQDHTSQMRVIFVLGHQESMWL